MARGEEGGAPSADLLGELLAEAGISLPRGAEEALLIHAREMLRWNRAIRLTAITSPLEVAVKHIVDSLLLLRFAPFPGRTMDFGAGAGYPGIPLAVARPEARVVLVESSGKKSAFLSHVRSVLGLENVEVVRGRIEKRAPLSLGRFAQIVTRATLPPREAAALLSPYLAPGGRLLLMTGPGEDTCAGTGVPGIPESISLARRLRFSLPRGMGEREILELTAAS